MIMATMFDEYGNVIEDEDICPPGGTVRVELPFMDGLSQRTSEVFEAYLERSRWLQDAWKGGSSKPDDDRSAEEAYADMKQRLSDAWRQPQRRALPKTSDAEAIREAAYREYVANLFRRLICLAGNSSEMNGPLIGVVAANPVARCARSKRFHAVLRDRLRTARISPHS
jgi:hypothetical protein